MAYEVTLRLKKKYIRKGDKRCAGGVTILDRMAIGRPYKKVIFVQKT